MLVFGLLGIVTVLLECINFLARHYILPSLSIVAMFTQLQFRGAKPGYKWWIQVVVLITSIELGSIY